MAQTTDGKPHKHTRTKTDILLITKEVIEQWEPPPFQRNLRVNDKVLALSEEIKSSGVLPGTITLGNLNKKNYLLDGQHRIHAFNLSELREGYAEVRTLFCEDMGEMGEEFVRLNSKLVTFKPDDILRGLENSNEHLAAIRKACPFIGYDMIRRSEAAPIVSMAGVLRAWFLSAPETPGGAVSAARLAARLTALDTEQLIAFYSSCLRAWGRDQEYYRLWGSLNVTLCAWLYRRTVIGQYTSATTKLTREQFNKSLMALSADSSYLDWLVGRLLNERDRSPCFGRIKNIVGRRIRLETGKLPRLPSPPWSSNSGKISSRQLFSVPKET